MNYSVRQPVRLYMKSLIFRSGHIHEYDRDTRIEEIYSFSQKILSKYILFLRIQRPR